MSEVNRSITNSYDLRELGTITCRAHNKRAGTLECLVTISSMLILDEELSEPLFLIQKPKSILICEEAELKTHFGFLAENFIEQAWDHIGKNREDAKNLEKS